MQVSLSVPCLKLRKMKQSPNRNQIRLTLILSNADNDILVNASNKAGLKKSEYLRAIIQGIGYGTKVAEQVKKGKGVKIEAAGYGLNIPISVMEDILQDVSKRLTRSLQITEIKPKKNLRYKRMKKAINAA